jgi:UDP-glucose 4-epimerase
MSTIWITGGKGFIGRNLARYVASEGATVFGIGHGFWPKGDAAQWSFAHWTNGEIESSNLSQLARISGSPDVVFHLAGGSSVGASFHSPQEDFSRTVETTARLMEWVRVHAVSAGVVCASSAAIYGAGRSGPIPESASAAPYSPYGHHKSMMEGIARSYGENFGLKVAIVRLFSVYGPELAKQLIWDICCKLDGDASAALLLGGSGRELRDWIHVADAVRLLWLARDLCGPHCAAVNGGTGCATAVAGVARIVCEAWGRLPADVQFSGVSRPGDPESLIADIALARSMGFAPRVPFPQGIAETVAWFRDHRGQSPRRSRDSSHVR